MQRRMLEATACGLAIALFAMTPATATTPPDIINYQGVLRDASDTPLDGTHDMVFWFFDAEVGGDSIIVDYHDDVNGNPVTVSGGLFNVALGGGVLKDGGGPGTYTSLAEVFRDYPSVWLEPNINGETLSPRTEIRSAAYALNADHLDGNDSTFFIDTSSVAQTKTGPLVVDASVVGGTGVRGIGSNMGGYFKDSDSTGYAEIGSGTIGIRAYGGIGGFFQDVDGTSWSDVAGAGYGIRSQGNQMGAMFQDTDDSGFVELAYGDYGIRGLGDAAGGYFYHSNGLNYASIGTSIYGIEGFGRNAGAYFADSNGSGYAYVGYGDYGIQGFGDVAGAYFKDVSDSGYAYLGSGNHGIRAYGTAMGALLGDADNTGYSYVGYADYGIQGFGEVAGGYFKDSDSSANAYVGYGDRGIIGRGDLAGGHFTDTNSSSYAYVGYGSYKIFGSGTVSFVQNHPYDKDRVIVYAAPEGAESATYTRGTARLVDGEARVKLDETFAWVTNPDIGLTAHLTPRGESRGLYVESLSTGEMVVREIGGGVGNVPFDYIVYGLRIGFEELSIVQEKEKEAYIPSMNDHRELYQRRPEWRRFNALERFKVMDTAAGLQDASRDYSASDALRAAIAEFDPEVHVLPEPEAQEHAPRPVEIDVAEQPSGASLDVEHGEVTAAASASPHDPSTKIDSAVVSSDVLPAATFVQIPTSEAVEAGDVLVFDPDRPGFLRRGTNVGDRAVVGIALADSAAASTAQADTDLAAMVAVGGIVPCKVDAAYGPIRVGDLLVVSPTPGHAMLGLDLAPGVTLGKAAEALDHGTGLIKVLITLR